jgi:hypothetical protein
MNRHATGRQQSAIEGPQHAGTVANVNTVCCLDSP